MCIRDRYSVPRVSDGRCEWQAEDSASRGRAGHRLGCQLIEANGRPMTGPRAGVPSLTSLRGAVFDNVGSTVTEMGGHAGAQHCLNRTAHRPPAAGADAPHPATFSPLGVLDVPHSTPPRPSGRKPHWARHLGALATKTGEKCGLTGLSRGARRGDGASKVRESRDVGPDGPAASDERRTGLGDHRARTRTRARTRVGGGSSI